MTEKKWIKSISAAQGEKLHISWGDKKMKIKSNTDKTMMVPPGWRIASRSAIVVITTKGARTMKTDLHCSTLHQVCPHCAPIRASPHYSSFKQPGRRRKEKSPLPRPPAPTHHSHPVLSSQNKKTRNQFRLLPLGSAQPSIGCLLSSLLTHTHKHKIPDTSLAPFVAPRHMANEKAPVRGMMMVIVAVAGGWGRGRWGGGDWSLPPTPPSTKAPHFIRGLHEYMGTRRGWMGRAEAVEKSSPGVGGGWGECVCDWWPVFFCPSFFWSVGV